ncbi:MAG: hypothetical protein K2M95_07470, partial [Clostridiales bacterium]|nr:hypothetical protein [Clostridiales bacterium]
VNGLADSTTQETLRARTWTDAEKADAAANSWLTYSFTTDGLTLQAKRYWTGTKPFYVRVKNAHGTPSWFKFYASIEGGELKKDKTLPATMADDFKFGKSTTQAPTEKGRKSETSPLRFASVEVTSGAVKSVDSIRHLSSTTPLSFRAKSRDLASIASVVLLVFPQKQRR